MDAVRRARPRALRCPRAAALLALLVIAPFAAGATAPTAEAGVAKSINVIPSQSDAQDPAQMRALAREIDAGLGSRWVRLQALWANLEPAQGAYSEQAFSSLDTLVDAFHARGLKVMLTLSATPDWASDRYWWSHPPTGYADGPRPFYPVSTQALPAYADLAESLGRRYAGKVQAVEVWNEPNLWMFLYPQRTATDPLYGVHAYLRMLKAFHKGLARVRTGMRVVAGTTGPIGLNDIYRTSPQRFARALKRAGAARYFDVYSHHPYTPGGSVYQAPDQPPNDPGTTVTLFNLRTLLTLFPSKPFYLSEYAYSTRPNLLFGLSVSEPKQARYLKASFAMAKRHRQVRMLSWYLLRDSAPYDSRQETGVYTGLRRLDGSKKPAWYAFRHIRE
jgi:hypothetical protein